MVDEMVNHVNYLPYHINDRLSLLKREIEISEEVCDLKMTISRNTLLGILSQLACHLINLS